MKSGGENVRRWRRDRLMECVRKVLDPSPCLPLVDDNGEDVWGSDPVHPLPHGFRLLVDMFETEIEHLQGKTRKRAGCILQPPSKRTKPAIRPAWISQQTATAVRREYGGGERGGRGRGGRGRGGRFGGFRGSRGRVSYWEDSRIIFFVSQKNFIKNPRLYGCK